MDSRGRTPKVRSSGLARFVLILVCLAGGCRARPDNAITPSPSVLPASAVALATQTPPAPLQQLVICTSELSAISPFLYLASNTDLLALYLEEPVERADYRWSARLVERVPSAGSGDVLVRHVPVTGGVRYMDSAGAIQTAASTSSLTLPQMVVTFTLQSDLRWSDGASVTARDALLGYHLAQSPQAEGRWRVLAERTARFVVINDRTLRWEGVPGYLTADYPGFLFPLQPNHRWQGKSLEAILEDRTPPATGPYKISAWEAGRGLRFGRNPYYAGATPVLDAVVVRFLSQPFERWGTYLASGECDILLPASPPAGEWRAWYDDVARDEAVVWTAVSPATLQLVFNVRIADAQSPVSDPQVRKAIGYCIDRQALAEALPYRAILPANSFYSPRHPDYLPTLAQVRHDPEEGRKLLLNASDSHRPADAADIQASEPLSLTLQAETRHLNIAERIAENLSTCGIHVSLQVRPAQMTGSTDAPDLLQSGAFEMTLVERDVILPEACRMWRSDQIPNRANDWQGANIAGFASEAYDAACQAALDAVDLPSQAAALQLAQGYLGEATPVIPLIWYSQWLVARPAVQGIRLDASAFSALWNSEEIFLDN